ncbi:hypothetical protein [Desulfovibrio legallii]|nr:hypothetical protein [Desulfovibrio legallii]
MSKFRYAWHVESEKMLEPDDVADFIMETGRPPEMMCPDENCRLTLPSTRITAVCCDPRNPDCGFTPHFRTHPGHKHAENCQYEVLGRHTDYILGHKDEFTVEFPDANLLRKIKGIDTELLPDEYAEEFAPHEFMEAVTRKAREYRENGASEERAFCRARCAIPQKTSRLGLIVDMAIKLADQGGDELRTKTILALPRRPKANYLNAFLMISALKHHYTTPYIIYGESVVHESSTGYIIEYKKLLKGYHPDHPELPACTVINPDRHTVAFLDELNRYASSGEICCVYSFSTHELRESTCPMQNKKHCVVIEPRFLNAITIKKTCVKRGIKPLPTS